MREYLPAPFTGGIVTDRPPWRLELDEASFAQDLIAPDGIAKQRRGWEFVGSSAVDSGDDNIGIIRVKHVLADETQTLVSDVDGDIAIHNGDSSGTTIANLFNDYDYLPRAVYRDEVLWCEQSGEVPLVRTSGSRESSTITGPTTQSITAGTSELAATSGSWSGAADAGSYLEFDVSGAYRYPRVLEGATTSAITMENVRPSNMSSYGGDADIYAYGYPYPCVDVDREGSVSLAGSTLTGKGTKWFDKGLHVDSDAMLVYEGTVDGGTYNFVVGVDAIGSNTSITVTSVSPRVGSGAATNARYATLRRMPFRDVAVHKGSLWGAGVKEHPSRVYVGRPGWDITNPPHKGHQQGDPDEDTFTKDANDFLMDYIDVPADRDGDDVVAILSSSQALLVLKRSSVHGIFGTFPSFEVGLVDEGVGCLDIRSAVQLEYGPFWAGEDGVYTFAGGQVVDLMRGKIGREWRALTRDFDFDTDYITIGEAYGHLVVHITTDSGATRRTFVADFEKFNPYETRWMSRVSNFNPRCMFSAKVPGEPEALLASDDDHTGRVIDFAPALNGTGDARDGDGDSPRLQGWTTSRLPQSGGVDLEWRLHDVHVHTVVEDAEANDTTELDVSVVYSGGLHTGSDVAETKAVGTIASDDDDELRMSEFGQVNTAGRLTQLRVDASTTDTDNAQVAVAEVVMTFRESRDRS